MRRSRTRSPTKKTKYHVTDSQLLRGVFEKRRDDGVGSCVTVEAIGTLTHGVACNKVLVVRNATGKCNGRGLDARHRRDAPT